MFAVVSFYFFYRWFDPWRIVILLLENYYYYDKHVGIFV